MVLYTSNFIYCANAGDCRAVACLKSDKKKANFQHLSYDHKPYLEHERNRIYKAGSFVDEGGRINGNLNLSRAVGDFNFKANKQLSSIEQAVISLPDVLKVPTNEVEFIIMGCDGIWETKTSEKMIKWIKKKLSSHKDNSAKVL